MAIGNKHTNGLHSSQRLHGMEYPSRLCLSVMVAQPDFPRRERQAPWVKTVTVLLYV